MRPAERRLQLKAAAAPSRGSGPGTGLEALGGPRKTWIVSLVPVMAQVPIRPLRPGVKPRAARVVPLKVVLLRIGVP